MKVYFTILKVKVAQSSPTLCNTMDYTVHGILQARILEWVSQLVQSCLTLCDPMDCSMLGLPVHHQFPEFTQTHVHWVSDAIQSSLLTSVFAGIFLNESAFLIRWPKYWSFSFSISVSNEYSWLISFRMDRLDLLAIQGTLKSLLQHHKTMMGAILQSQRQQQRMSYLS